METGQGWESRVESEETYREGVERKLLPSITDPNTYTRIQHEYNSIYYFVNFTKGKENKKKNKKQNKLPIFPLKTFFTYRLRLLL